VVGEYVREGGRQDRHPTEDDGSGKQPGVVRVESALDGEGDSQALCDD